MSDNTDPVLLGKLEGLEKLFNDRFDRMQEDVKAVTENHGKLDERMRDLETASVDKASQTKLEDRVRTLEVSAGRLLLIASIAGVVASLALAQAVSAALFSKRAPAHEAHMAQPPPSMSSPASSLDFTVPNFPAFEEAAHASDVTAEGAFP